MKRHQHNSIQHLFPYMTLANKVEQKNVKNFSNMQIFIMNHYLTVKKNRCLNKEKTLAYLLSLKFLSKNSLALPKNKIMIIIVNLVKKIRVAVRKIHKPSQRIFWYFHQVQKISTIKHKCKIIRFLFYLFFLFARGHSDSSSMQSHSKVINETMKGNETSKDEKDTNVALKL